MPQSFLCLPTTLPGAKLPAASFARQLEQVQAELKPLNEIRYWVGQVLGPEQVEALDKVEGKQSVVEQLRQAGEQNQKQDRAPQKEQEQKMEL